VGLFWLAGWMTWVAGGEEGCGSSASARWWGGKTMVVAGIGRRVAALTLPLLAGVCW